MSLDTFLAEELAKNDVNGTWKLELNDTNTPPTSPPATPNYIINWSLSFGKGLVADNAIVIPNLNDATGLAITPVNAAVGVIGTLTVLGSVPVPSSPVEVGSDVVMAKDNTLGSYSPYEGRIYLAFVGYYNVTVNGFKNPAADTEIFLTYSDNGGRTWSDPTQVNNDSAQSDGLSTANDTNFNDYFDGESQYQPAIAVDQTTGTVVMTWRDARNDPANTLVATYIASSIDGGNTFSAQVYANPQSTAIDAISGSTDVLGPESDNAVAAGINGTFGYGTSMGLAVYAGQVYPIWAGNFDGAYDNNGTLDGNSLSVYYRPMVIAAGPRIVTSTQGPVVSYAEAASGQVSFTVSFDRPINPPGLSASFTAADVQVFYQDTIYGDPSVALQVLSVVPVIASGVGPDNKFGYTQFTVTFSTAAVPQGNYTGTYSYLITPDDENGSPIQAAVTSYILGYTPDTKALGPFSSGTINLPIPSTKGGGGTGTGDDITTSTIAVNGYNNQVLTGVTLNLTLTASVADDIFVTLTAPDGQTATVPVVATAPDGSVNLQQFRVPARGPGRRPGQRRLHADHRRPRGQRSRHARQLVGHAQRGDAGRHVAARGTGRPECQRHARREPPDDAGRLHGPDPGRRLRDAHASAHGADDVHDRPEHPQPPVRPEHPAADRPRPPGAFHPGGRDHRPDLRRRLRQLGRAGRQHDQPVQRDLRPAGPDQQLPGQPGGVDHGPARPDHLRGILRLQLDRSADPRRDLLGLRLSPLGPDHQHRRHACHPGYHRLAQHRVHVRFHPLRNPGGAERDDHQALLRRGRSLRPELRQHGLRRLGDDLHRRRHGTVHGDLQARGQRQRHARRTPGPGRRRHLATRGHQHPTGVASTLDSWSLNITPQITVKPLNPTTTTINGVSETVATEYGILFPQQQSSGTYTIQLGPNIEDEYGNQMDVTGDAGLSVLRDYEQTRRRPRCSTPPATCP